MFATEIRWYRSRSKTTEGTWVHGPRTRYSQSLRKYLSIFQEEIHVTEKCIHFNQAIKALSSYAINSKMVWGCVEKLSGLSEENTVTLTWTPGHNGVTGNEIADSFERLTGYLKKILSAYSVTRVKHPFAFWLNPEALFLKEKDDLPNLEWTIIYLIFMLKLHGFPFSTWTLAHGKGPHVK